MAQPRLLMSRLNTNCTGVTRRDFIQLGLGGTLGLGLCDLLRLRAHGAEALAKTAPKFAGQNVNCILVWLDGGPSHYETFDPKPEAPSEIRGEFKAIPTKVPGLHFSECVPRLAGVADKVSIVRSIWHKDPNHGGGNHYMMTGAPTPVPVACGAFVTFHPSFGSMVSSDRGLRHGLLDGSELALDLRFGLDGLRLLPEIAKSEDMGVRKVVHEGMRRAETAEALRQL